MKNLFNVLNSSKGPKEQEAQNTRADIIGELEAIIQYQAHIDATDNPVVINTLTDIMNEEKVHVGQLFGLLFYLDPDSKTYFEKGYTEFMEKSQQK